MLSVVTADVVPHPKWLSSINLALVMKYISRVLSNNPQISGITPQWGLRKTLALLMDMDNIRLPRRLYDAVFPSDSYTRSLKMAGVGLNLSRLTTFSRI